MGGLPKGRASIAITRLWAAQTRHIWRMSKEEWGQVGVMDRAEMICAVKLDGWLESLEQHRQMEEMKQRG